MIETLEFENPHFLQSLFANDPALLKLLEKRFAVRVTTRDGWVRFEGEDAGVDQARDVFSQLEAARRKGAEITEHSFRFAIDAASNGDGEANAAEFADFRLLGSPTKPAVTPRTKGQLDYVKAMDESEVVFGLGPAGTGKTYLAMARALAALLNKEVNRLVLTRPAVEAGEALGFLPGDLKEKIFPYLRPLYDALYDMIDPDKVERLIERGQIEVAPLAYMRGRTLARAYVILDEAQNTTREQMFMFLTRIGEGSRAIITGDPSQVDLRPNIQSGLHEAQAALRDTDGVRFVHFQKSDVVRHRVVQNIIEAYHRHRGE
ncbi:MAG: PhoH family protein [Verrucomicrobiales bacterium]